MREADLGPCMCDGGVGPASVLVTSGRLLFFIFQPRFFPFAFGPPEDDREGMGRLTERLGITGSGPVHARGAHRPSRLHECDTRKGPRRAFLILNRALGTDWSDSKRVIVDRTSASGDEPSETERYVRGCVTKDRLPLDGWGGTKTGLFTSSVRRREMGLSIQVLYCFA